ncbi:tyrosine-protein kinase RYK isoform X2 [Notamacropus eugenii]|uniref:tyrosine-protein kinase RYK isoform X2 n=1 Tax=Notamacropus eugenii TaxID=9315 RepID=UPI003B677D00
MAWQGGGALARSPARRGPRARSAAGPGGGGRGVRRERPASCLARARSRGAAARPCAPLRLGPAPGGRISSVLGGRARGQAGEDAAEAEARPGGLKQRLAATGRGDELGGRPRLGAVRGSGPGVGVEVEEEEEEAAAAALLPSSSAPPSSSSSSSAPPGSDMSGAEWPGPPQPGRGRGRGPRAPGLPPPPPRALLLLLPPLLLLLLPEPGAGVPAAAERFPLPLPPAVGPSVSLYLSEEEVHKLLGIDAELYYVRNDLINHYALSFNLLVPSDTNYLHFTWYAKSKVEYKLGFQIDNPVAMDMPQVNISIQGEVPRTLSVFRVELSCTGKVDSEIMVLMQLNLTINSSKNFTVLNFKRRKMCYKKLEEVKTPTSDKNGNRTIYDPVNAAPTTSTRVFYISVGVCCAVIFLVAIILAVLHLHSMKRIELDDSISDSSSSQGLSQPSTQTTQYLRADTPNNATPVTSYPTLRIEKNDLKSVTLMEAKAKVKDIAISRERITLKDVLQEGTFGRIFHGILIDDKDPNKEKQAFVKTVKDQASEIQVTMMLTESCKLRGLHHRNLLPITHVCIEEGEKPMVLLPYMNWGNLKLFLRQCKLVEANNPQAISQQDLVHMAIQIACGMSYLARREVIHKDLAARNCVIDDTLQVKITDNALSRDLFPMDYHCLGDNENRPVRWMALESLVNNEFSSASDVWAFGVTLWELMTLGQTPYVDIDPFEMAAYLKDGYRIAQPINCPDELFAVMACCWALDPEERPKFQQLVQCLTEFHAALGAYV